MAAKKRKGKTDVGHELSEETVSVLSSIEDTLPQTKILLSTKPHITAGKRDCLEESLKELRTYVKYLSDNIFTYDKEDQEKHAKIMFAITTYLKTILDFEDYSHSVNFRAIINNAVYLLIDHSTNQVDAKLRNHIALLSLRFMEIADFDENELFIGSMTLGYFLNLTLMNTEGDKNVRKVDIKHVWSMHKFVEVLDFFDPENTHLVEKLLSTVSNLNYVKYKEGHSVIGHLMSRNVTFAMKIHQKILAVLPKISKQLASGYGYAYFIGWSLAKEDEIREAIESCIQDIMVKVLKGSRGGLEMSKAGASGFALLSVLHQSRRLKKFSDVLNRLYTSILWRTLRSSDPWERCNGTQVFLDVFPLEMPYLSEPDNANYMDRQIKEIQDVLLDESHFVRILAIKGVCAHLTRSLELFSITHVRNIMKILVEDLANDGSTYLVRKAVYEGFEMMVNGPADVPEGAESESAAVLEPLLPLMYLSIHDENEKVRKAVVRLLLKIKEKSSVMKIRYWDVVPLKHLVVRLAYEGPLVGELLVKLIMSEFYTKGQETDKTINRLLRLMNWNLSAIKPLFHYSKNVLSVDQAFLIIVTLIGITRKKLREHLDSLSETENENKKEDITRKKKRKGSLEDISNKNLDKEKSSEGETSTSSSSPPARTPNQINAEFLENHRYIAGLINGATVLWVAFRKEISENDTYLDKLYALACSAVPLFLKHYKGTCVYYATVSFASLIPIAKLKGVSTVSSACISELKEITEGTNVTKIQCLIYSLCSWHRGHDVLDLASEWLNYAFREQNLNNSAMPVRVGQRAAKVRFVPTEGKPMLSLKLLEVLFSDVLNETRLISKNYEQLHEFFMCLERIVVIIERKVAGVEYFKPDTQLTDEFLSKAYFRYLRMMHALHRPEVPPEATDSVPPFDATVATLEAITWANKTLYPHIPSNGGTGQPPLAVCCCLSVLEEATLAVDLGITNEAHCKSVALFASDLLSIDCVWFLEEVLHTIRVLSDYVQDETPNDEWCLLKDILPHLLQKVLNVISTLEVTATTAKQYFEDIPAMKNALFSVPKAILSLSGAKAPLFADTFRMYINTCIQIVMQEILKEDELITHTKFDQQPYFVSFMLKHIIIQPSFTKNLFPALLYYINLYKEEGNKLLSCFSLLFTIIFTAKSRFDGVELEIFIQEAYQILKGYQDKAKTTPGDLEDTTFTSSTVNINVKKAGESIFEEISRYLNCSLIKPLSAQNSPVSGRSTPKSRVGRTPTARPGTTPARPISRSAPNSRASSACQLSSAIASKLVLTPANDHGVFRVPSIPGSSPAPRNRTASSSRLHTTSASRTSSVPLPRPNSTPASELSSVLAPESNSTLEPESSPTSSSEPCSTPLSGLRPVSAPKVNSTPVLKSSSPPSDSFSVFTPSPKANSSSTKPGPSSASKASTSSAMRNTSTSSSES